MKVASQKSNAHIIWALRLLLTNNEALSSSLRQSPRQIVRYPALSPDFFSSHRLRLIPYYYSPLISHINARPMH